MACARIASFALLLAPPPALGAPAGEAPPLEGMLTEADLGPVYNVANILSNRPPCAGDTTDLAAASAFVRAASLFDVASRHYPFRPSPRSDPGMHARKRLAVVDAALQLYEQAYQCAPGYPHRHPLESAIALLDAARELTVTTDRLPLDAPELEQLAARRSDLAIRLPAPPRAPPCPARVTYATGPTPEPKPIRFVLRPEIGVGTGRVTNVGADRKTDDFSGVYGQIVAAARSPLGARRLHAITMGGIFGVQQVAPVPAFELQPTRPAIVQGGLHLEFALHAHPRWFSFHPALDLGAQTYIGIEKLGRTFISPTLGLCLDREIVCFNFRASLPLTSPKNADARIPMGQFGLAVDLMRIAERRRGK